MSAPVDVLVVMSDVQAAAGDYDAERLQGIAAGDVLDEARAAVAELIEAAKGMRAVTGGGTVCTVSESLAAYRRLDAALARVNGGAA